MNDDDDDDDDGGGGDDDDDDPQPHWCCNLSQSSLACGKIGLDVPNIEVGRLDSSWWGCPWVFS